MNNIFIDIYYKLVKEDGKAIEAVPENIRQAVQEKIDADMAV